MQMFCSACGKKNSDQASFCFSCGQPLPPPQGAGRVPRRPGASSQVVTINRTRPGIVTLLAILQFIGAAVTLLIAAFFFAVDTSTSHNSTQLGGILLATFFGVVALTQVLCAVGLLKLRNWARLLQMAMAWIGIVAFPVGTIIAILILVYLFKPGVRLLFSNRDFDDLAPPEIAQVFAVTQSSGSTTAAVIIIVGFGMVPVMGIVAAIAIPSLLRARVAANEASAIGTVRMIGVAQENYFNRCNRYAMELQQFGPDDGLPAALSADATVTKDGYLFAIEPGASAELLPATAECPGGVTEYFVHADPATPGSSGLRYFALDERNLIVQAHEAIPNPIPDGTALLK